MSERIFVGVLRLVLHVPGARTRKDRRQVVRSVADRVRHRFDVTFHEIDDLPTPTRQTVVMTTAGNDPALIRSILDKISGFVGQHPAAIPAEVDADVFRWHPSGGSDWADRMMAELSAPESDDG